MPGTVTVATLNLLNDAASWPRRAPLVLAGCREAAPDILCLQEVNRPLANAEGLAEALGGYEAVVAAKRARRDIEDGLAVVTRFPVLGQDRLELGGGGRAALRVDLDVRGARLAVVVTHLVWSPLDGLRQGQVEKLLAWLPAECPVLVAGDMNAPPHWPSMRRLAARLPSAHVTVHGREPDWTFPTGQLAASPAHRVARPFILRAAGLRIWGRLAPWRGTLDYIFCDPRLTVLDCSTAFAAAAAYDPRLFASDHLGVVARLAWP